MIEFLKAWTVLKSDKRGVTMVEYGLMAALIAVVCIGAVTTLGGDLSTKFNDIAGKVSSAGAPAAATTP
jgi:pilus assembly protein Flp/PilA